MKTTNNTILVTGGGSGIGYEITKLFSAKDNHIIIAGRNEAKLLKTASEFSNVTVIPADITDEADVENLVNKIKADFPNLNILINNAGSAFALDLATGKDIYEKAANEIDVNYLSVIRLTEKLLPVLTKQPEAAIVNVTSIVALVPSKAIPTYSASKAALRSYTQLLRLALKDTTVKVFELLPPLVNTEFSKEIGGEQNGIPPALLASDLLKAFEDDSFEIHTGQTKDMYALSLSSPATAFEAMNA